MCVIETLWWDSSIAYLLAHILVSRCSFAAVFCGLSFQHGHLAAPRDRPFTPVCLACSSTRQSCPSASTRYSHRQEESSMEPIVQPEVKYTQVGCCCSFTDQYTPQPHNNRFLALGFIMFMSSVTFGVRLWMTRCCGWLWRHSVYCCTVAFMQHVKQCSHNTRSTGFPLRAPSSFPLVSLPSVAGEHWAWSTGPWTDDKLIRGT